MVNHVSPQIVTHQIGVPKHPGQEIVNRQGNGTPYRHAKGTPVGAALQACPGSEQEGSARAVERPTSGETAGAGGCLFAHLGKLMGSVRRGF
jgi:hypothetical protein